MVLGKLHPTKGVHGSRGIREGKPSPHELSEGRVSFFDIDAIPKERRNQPLFRFSYSPEPEGGTLPCPLNEADVADVLFEASYQSKVANSACASNAE